uniref:DBF4-type domain-containing protein n=1 Tax=Graphocephala atropunctata TaxID=36148 RepID=A0A1B6MBB6_9HEMI
MVSPSKKRKDRKGRSENEDKSLSATRVKQSDSRRPSKPFKPLASKKFYLDIKSSASLLKLETKLKSLGAIIEQFLVKEVNYVVSDRKDAIALDNHASCSTPGFSPSPSPSPLLGVSSPVDGLGQKKTKSRAEAMLERVRLQPQTVRIDPLDNARSWNIPIYSIQEILLRLEKICQKQGSGKSAPGLKVLKGHYLKVETGRRPEFKQLREWPSINVNSNRGDSPFNPYGALRMTRKLSKDGTERLAGGYCELCAVDFPDLKTHVLTPQHLKCANNADYYAQLDNIIQSKTADAFFASQMCAGLAAGPRRCLRSSSVESQANIMGSRNSSLTQNNGQLTPRTRASTRSLDDACTKKPLEVHCNGIVNNHNHLTRSAVKSDSILVKYSGLECEGILRRTRTISASCPGTNNELSQLSPTGSDITHHLRSRKQMWLPTSLLGTTAEDALNNSRLRASRDYPISEAMKSPTQGKGALKSPSTPLPDDAERKMKSSGKDEADRNSFRPDCNDAEKSRSQDSTDEDENSRDKLGGKKCENAKVKSDSMKKVNLKKKYRKKSIPREKANSRYNDSRKKVLKKRLSVEEKLIEDNRTYYKVEVLNSKLRSTGYYISQSQRELELSKANGNDGCVTQNSSEPAKTEVKSEEKEPVVVRFKKVRQTELSLLSDEAESFMFGEPSRRESSVSTESSEEDDEVSLKLGSDDHERVKYKKEVLDESSMGSCSIASSSNSSRRKRKSPEESFLQDNAEYYKFETTGSRLRFHGNLFPPTPVPDCKKVIEEISTKPESSNDSKLGNSLKVKLDESYFGPESTIDEEKVPRDSDAVSGHSYRDLEFSFESAPKHEPWYQTFKRQDECSEHYYPGYTDYPRVLLPYEYPNSVIRRIKMAAIKDKPKKKGRKPKKVQQLIVDDKPRKSPRCHASTLAIMSSLMRRRPRDSPEKRSEFPSSELSLVHSEMVGLVLDEESRCSTIVEPPSVAPSDTQVSVTHTPIHTIPEIRIDTKENVSDSDKTAAEIKRAEERIDELFSEICSNNDDDALAQILQAVKKEVESSPVKESTSHKKGKSKSKTAKREPPCEFQGVVSCLPVDPEIVYEEMPDLSNKSGPIMDVMNIIDGYRSCSSMERADYEHMNPHAVDALRVLIAESCNSSDCGGSSACDYSFLEDGRVCKKRKRKKRNMTGWPANHKRKFIKKNEELSMIVLRRNCKAKDGLSVDSVSVKKEIKSEPQSEKLDVSEIDVKLKEEPSAPCDHRQQTLGESEAKVDSVKSEVKPCCSTISRTTSIDSSSIKSLDVPSCYIWVKKMPEDCVESFTRQLRSSDSSPPKSSSVRRGSSRQAKTAGRESLRRCR